MSDAPHCPYPALPPPLALELTESPEHPCSYLPDRLARTRAFSTRRLPGTLYHQFMDAGFRRSGLVIYQPTCSHCRRCLPLRVPVETFAPSTSQRRCVRRNADLIVSVGPPTLTDEKLDLYRRYQAGWHDKPEATTREDLESFLYQSPVETVEFSYRDPAGLLLAVGICDLCPESLSSVYFYHDPAHRRRGLGVFGTLQEIHTAQRLQIPHYYLGYWVDGCRSMQYKTDYRPCQLLHPDGIWRDFRPETGQICQAAP